MLRPGSHMKRVCRDRNDVQLRQERPEPLQGFYPSLLSQMVDQGQVDLLIRAYRQQDNV